MTSFPMTSLYIQVPNVSRDFGFALHHAKRTGCMHTLVSLRNRGGIKLRGALEVTGSNWLQPTLQSTATLARAFTGSAQRRQSPMLFRSRMTKSGLPTCFPPHLRATDSEYCYHCSLGTISQRVGKPHGRLPGCNVYRHAKVCCCPHACPPCRTMPVTRSRQIRGSAFVSKRNKNTVQELYHIGSDKCRTALWPDAPGAVYTPRSPRMTIGAMMFSVNVYLPRRLQNPLLAGTFSILTHAAFSKKSNKNSARQNRPQR